MKGKGGGTLDDAKIVDLYFERDENAIRYTDEKYGAYCQSIAFAILYAEDEAEECKNDTYWKAWNAMPPVRPSFLKSFLGKITRRLALDRYDYNRAQKRDAASTLVWDEISDAIPDLSAEPADGLALKEAVNGFLAALSARDRIIFLRRYFYFISVADIARQSGMKEGAVKVLLHRLRQKFKQYLEKKGIAL